MLEVRKIDVDTPQRRQISKSVAAVAAKEEHHEVEGFQVGEVINNSIDDASQFRERHEVNAKTFERNLHRQVRKHPL